jgi:hypothetical protein
MLTSEFEPPAIDAKPYECCGGFTTRLTRFVLNDGDAYAAYCAMFSDPVRREAPDIRLLTAQAEQGMIFYHTRSCRWSR